MIKADAVEKGFDIIKGIGASPGVALGTAFIWKKDCDYEGDDTLRAAGAEEEVARFRSAVARAIEDVESLKRQPRQGMNEAEQEMLEMQIEMLSDPQLHGDVIALINNKHCSAVTAVTTVCQQLITALGALGSEYLGARAADVRASGELIIRHLRGKSRSIPAELPAGSVIVADDLSPMEALSINLGNVTGIVTRAGAVTSHTAILARARNIPTVVACGDQIDAVWHGEQIIVDGSSGQVIGNPTKQQLGDYTGKKNALDTDRQRLLSQSSTKARTPDGREIQLLANISGPHDMTEAIASGAEGVGLFRTELLFMSHGSFPTEEEQFEYYKQVVLAAQRYPVTIRTLDIGGDKPLPYQNLGHEENPFLGYRAIRVSLREPVRFVEQLRAILRASAYGNVRIMFPLITGMSELREAKRLLRDAQHQLEEQGTAFDKDVPVGVMIETPAAALLADRLAKEVDFFSIGTNDLCQYTLAVDRGNDDVKELYDLLHPAMLRLIAGVLEQAAINKIEVSICGELAGDPRATLLLMGIGLCSFSVNAYNIPVVKDRILRGTHLRALQIAADVLDMDDVSQINEYLTEEALNRNI